jgi:hypothetical protein
MLRLQNGFSDHLKRYCEEEELKTKNTLRAMRAGTGETNDSLP